jgi:glycosyltransferase involved in cell wall biosynthesis
MRILIDATPLLLRSAGVKNFVYYWLSSLQRQAASNKIAVFPFLPDLGKLNHQESIIGELATRARLQLVNLLNIRDNHVLDVFIGRSYDVFHASQHLRNPPRNGILTATIYDMSCWLLPEMHTKANVAATKEYAERILCRANGLIAISKSSRDDAVRILGLREDSIQVIYPGIPQAFFQVTESQVEQMRRKYSTPERYLLFLGCVEPRKNLKGVLDAWEMLPLAIRSECQLIAAGPLGWENKENTARLLGGQKGIRYLGYVAEEDLPAVMAGATGLVYPSYYEGFGLPVAQAMAAGTPVITSNISCLPEIAGDAALLVNPHSPGEISNAMRELLSSSALCRGLRIRGIRRAEQFNWEDNAKQSLSFFHKIADSN